MAAIAALSDRSFRRYIPRPETPAATTAAEIHTQDVRLIGRTTEAPSACTQRRRKAGYPSIARQAEHSLGRGQVLTRLCDEALHRQTKLVGEEVVPAGRVFREERVIVVVHLCLQASKSEQVRDDRALNDDVLYQGAHQRRAEGGAVVQDSCAGIQQSTTTRL